MPLIYSDYEGDDSDGSPPAKRRRTETDHLRDIKGVLRELLQQLSELRQDVSDIKGRLEEARLLEESELEENQREGSQESQEPQESQEAISSP